jgi:hypothetical protein
MDFEVIFLNTDRLSETITLVDPQVGDVIKTYSTDGENLEYWTIARVTRNEIFVEA